MKTTTYHSKIPADAKHAIDNFEERYGTPINVKGLSRIRNKILKGQFKEVPQIKCGQGRSALLGRWQGIKILVVFQKRNNRITTFLPLERLATHGLIDMSDTRFTSIGAEVDFDSVLSQEKGRQTPPLN